MINIYISYNKADYYFFDELQYQINNQIKGGLLSIFTYESGAIRHLHLNSDLRKAQIIIFLVSPDLLDSSFIMDLEVNAAIEQQKKGDSIILPIIIKKCDWKSSLFYNFQVYDFSNIEHHEYGIEFVISEINRIAVSKNDFKGLIYAKRRIAENIKGKERSINLSNCGLKDLSELQGLWKCKHLELLNLGLIESLGYNEGAVSSKFPYFGENQIGEEGAKLISKYFPKLKHLYLSGNKIGDEGAKSIAQNLLELNSLDLFLNSISDESVKEIAKNLKYLNYLNLGSNEIGDLGAKYIGTNLKNLSLVSFHENNIGDTGAKYIAKNLKKLTTLDLGINKLSGTGVFEIAQNLKKLTFLDLGANAIGYDGAKAIATHLKNLSTIKLDHNNIGDEGIEVIVKNLKKLEEVDFFENNTSKIRYEILNSINGLREHFGVSLDDNNNIEINLIPNNTTKFILVGNSTAGKTTLSKYLLTEKFATKHDSTHGVQCWIWEPIINGQKYKVNIKDFGGQDYFHATHSMFLDLESLFILLHNNEVVHNSDCKENDQYHNIDYWLGNISDVLQDNSNNQKKDQTKYAVWYVQNKTDHSSYQKEWLGKSKYADQTTIEQQFFISIKAAFENEVKPIEWRHFMEQLYEKIVTLSTTEIAEWWAAIRDEALPIWRTEKKLYLTRDEFSLKCKEFLDSNIISYITENESFAGILEYLKNSGEVVWFDDKPALSNYIFTSADSLTNHIFANILDRKAKKNGGVIKLAKTSDEIDIYINVLKAYGLIFEKEAGIFIAPQFLPEEPHIDRFLHFIPLSFAIRFNTYMPRYLITRMITYFAQREDDVHYWRYGIMYKKFGIFCLIKVDVNNQIIYVHVEDRKGKYDLLFEIYLLIMSKGTLNELIEKVKGVSSIESFNISLNETLRMKKDSGNKEFSLNGVDFASFENWRSAMDNRSQYVQSKENKYLPLSALVYKLLGGYQILPKRVFLSYSHLDEEHLNDLKAHMSGPEMSGLIDVWHDRKIDGGQLWDDVIRTELKNADIVLLMLSHNFMKSRYIWETEIPIAKSAGAIIVPIFLSPVYFKESVHHIYNHQGFPNDTKWILGESWKNKNEAYMAVVEGLVKLLEE